MIKRILLLAALWFCLTVYESCCPDRPYYLFQKVSVEILTTTIAQNDSLTFYVFPEISEYVASKGSLISSSFAFSCEQGHSGPKHPITDISIITVNDFDANHLAGQPATDLFWIEVYNQGVPQSVSLPLLEDKNRVFNGLIYTHARPTNSLSSTAHFVIRITNASGQVEVMTPLIIWD